MSEQQKDASGTGNTDKGATVPAPIETPPTSAAEAGTEKSKPKRRSTAKAKAGPEAGDEPAKPKRSRSSKAKNVLVDAPPVADALPVGKIQERAPQLGLDTLPPLPPAPVPTAEGIAFMQQHVAYQAALDQRSELERARLARSSQAFRQTQVGIAQDIADLKAESSAAAGAVPGAIRDVDADEKAAAAKSLTAKKVRAPKENAIEAGSDVHGKPIGEGDMQSLHDAEDQHLLHQVLERSRALGTGLGNTPAAESVAATAHSDAEALRMMKDATARKLGLAVVERNRHEAPGYKTAFDKAAPELTVEAQEANTGKPGTARSSGVALEKIDEDGNRSTAVPESVRKRFLKVDSDYYFPDRSPAFVDRGARLATRGEHPEVVVALVEIAKEREWNSITVKGSEAFRRAAWMEAVRSGLQVAGYKPTELDLAQLKQREPANLIEPAAEREQQAGRSTSQEKPIDPALHEKLSAFANDKPTLAVKKHPDLVQAYALLDAARKFAEVHMPGHESEFVAIGKEMITQQLRDGKEIIGPKVHPDHLSPSRSERHKPGSTTDRAAEVQVRTR